MAKTLTLTRLSKEYALPLWKWYLGGFIVLAIVNGITLAVPRLAKDVVNTISADAVTSNTTNITLAIIGLGFLMMITRAISRILIFWPGRKIEASLKDDLFARLLSLPQSYFIRHGMGDLISRLANDVGQVRVFFAFGMLQIVNMVFLLLMTIAQMASMHATLTVLCILPLGLMVFITRFVMPIMHKYSMENQQAVGSLTNRVTEAFVNVHVIQANAAEHTFEGRAEEFNEEVFRTNMKLVTVRTLLFPLMTMLSGLSIVVILLYGGHQVIAGELSAGDILAFNVYIGLLTFPLTAMGIILGILQRARAAIARVGEIKAGQPETVHSSDHSGDTEAVIEIRNLNYQYTAEEDSGFSLDNLNLKIMPGQRVGIFGPIGCGKSTLFNLLTRISTPDPGMVFFKGRDVVSIPPAELRQRIGYALQTVHLFSESIRDNLSYGLDDIDQPQLDTAAAAAQIDKEIESFDDGWSTQIGEKGVRLSGGQKQRLALARVFLRSPDLLILDDVLSAVDHTTEKNLVQYIHTTKSALLIASHRGTALRACDEILIMQEGKFIDRGGFDELVARYPDLAADTGN